MGATALFLAAKRPWGWASAGLSLWHDVRRGGPVQGQDALTIETPPPEGFYY